MGEIEGETWGHFVNFAGEIVVGNVKAFPRYIYAWTHHATNTFLSVTWRELNFPPVVLSLNRLAGNIEGTNSEEEPATVQWRTVGKIAQLYPFPLLKKTCARFLSQDHRLNFNYDPSYRVYNFYYVAYFAGCGEGRKPESKNSDFTVLRSWYAKQRDFSAGLFTICRSSSTLWRFVIHLHHRLHQTLNP